MITSEQSIAETNIPATQSRLSLVILGVSIVGVVLIVALLTRNFVEQQLRQKATNLLATHTQSISSSIERLKHLPISAARDKDLIALLEAAYRLDDTMTSELAGATNRYLESVATPANASIFYVIDVLGNTVASSNWRDQNSLVGNNYSFRPYFTDAIKGTPADYFAIGTITKEAGYYFSYPVTTEQGTIGIVVVKTELESLQAQWPKNDGHLILFDEHGVSVLASVEQWRFRTLSAEPPKNIDELRDQNKYATQPITPLAGSDASLLKTIQLNNTNYIVTSETLENENWVLWHLTPYYSVTTATILAVAASFLLVGLSVALFLYRRENIRKKILTSAALDAENMRRLNQKMEVEIAERIQAQHELNAAQAELIKRSKLAALGEMSAAIVHEVNQPLAAMRTFGASAKLLLDRGQTDAVKSNLDEIGALTERLATITTDLKMFASKPNITGEPICVQDCIYNVLRLVKPSLLESCVSISHSLPATAAHVRGSSIRLEQVITNLLTNAIDATKSRLDDREIKIHLFVDGDEVVLRVSDNGTGIDTHTIKHLFDPFFTTKPIGEGVGLGLAISYGIVQEMGGVIQVRNNDDSGALFSLRLKMTQSENSTQKNASSGNKLNG